MLRTTLLKSLDVSSGFTIAMVKCTEWQSASSRKRVVFLLKWSKHKLNLPLGRLSVPCSDLGTFSTNKKSLQFETGTLGFFFFSAGFASLGLVDTVKALHF